MYSMYKHLYNHASQALPSIKHHSQLQTSGSDFPILTVSVLSVVITVFMLLCYYIFVVKCCISNRHQLNLLLLRRFSLSQARRSSEDSLMSYSPNTLLNRGLDESLIRDLPTSQFSRRGGEIGCVFCLSEFQDEDILRVLPKCSHEFHLDCIDVWLQSNSNCPLCRSSIISGSARYPNDHITAPSSSPQGSQPFIGSFMGSDEDFVVIELRGEQGDAIMTNRVLEQEDYSRDTKIQSSIPSPDKPMKRKHCKSKLPNGSSMGDECLNVRGRDDQFSVQPIRRSISLNSAAERQLFLSVQEALREKSKNQSEEPFAASEGSCSSRIRRSFFPFGNGRGSRNAVLPIEI